MKHTNEVKMSKQTVVQKILEQMNLLSNSEFRFWMLYNSDELLSMEKEQIIDAYGSDRIPCSKQDCVNYYNEIFK